MDAAVSRLPITTLSPKHSQECVENYIKFTADGRHPRRPRDGELNRNYRRQYILHEETSGRTARRITPSISRCPSLLVGQIRSALTRILASQLFVLDGDSSGLEIYTLLLKDTTYVVNPATRVDGGCCGFTSQQRFCHAPREKHKHARPKTMSFTKSHTTHEKCPMPAVSHSPRPDEATRRPQHRRSALVAALLCLVLRRKSRESCSIPRSLAGL